MNILLKCVPNINSLVKYALSIMLAGMTWGVAHAHGIHIHGGGVYIHGGHGGYYGDNQGYYGGYHHGYHGGLGAVYPYGVYTYPSRTYTYTYPAYPYGYGYNSPDVTGHLELLNGQWVFVLDAD